ncbi:menaquinone-dependent protoporphyrinogen IX dehydrogenase [Ferrimonas balearica]|uniref:menaquinone-dependent protoporphyrinogen IX dehydrogenase n=1 Tax=Ferrimonas balearica TaxID=44012 RepID=UPI001C993380|nr:menaquinone-dependent protoporphyrinogen IX dehydrogenase [Ferrimonas balearica]MBY5923488.1 menaquinone-dependent protoporphyrinogen IX dehydrogenase [Ferrimonas balearica]MBY5997867.1 menaquinone-dependent protoporphyrinogen IX dehydrogenase [Ferrimonas balearica]
MTRTLVLYMSRGGHTARVARTIMETLQDEGQACDMMDLLEAEREGIDWTRYQRVVMGAPVLYGTYDKSVFAFIEDNRAELEARPSSFFNVSVVARTPEKSTVEGNRYMQKFLELSPWRPTDLKVIAGKVDYPNWGFLDSLAIRLIMKMTNGPTDPKTVIDYTDWEDVRDYARHLATLS